MRANRSFEETGGKNDMASEETDWGSTDQAGGYKYGKLVKSYAQEVRAWETPFFTAINETLWLCDSTTNHFFVHLNASDKWNDVP